MTITIFAILNAFSNYWGACVINPTEFYKVLFDPAVLQRRLDYDFGSAAPSVPADLCTAGWADKREVQRYAGIVAARLAELGVEVIA